MKKRALLGAMASLIFLSACSSSTGKPTTTPTTPTQTATTPTPSTTPAVTTTPTAPKAQYSLTDIATHNKASDCRTTINTNVYNITSFFGKHPGGDDKLLLLCGKDGTAAFNTKHGQSDKAKTALGTLIIGTLK